MEFRVAIRGGGERTRKTLASRMKLSVPSVSPMAWLCYFYFFTCRRTIYPSPTPPLFGSASTFGAGGGEEFEGEKGVRKSSHTLDSLDEVLGKLLYVPLLLVYFFFGGGSAISLPSCSASGFFGREEGKRV